MSTACCGPESGAADEAPTAIDDCCAPAPPGPGRGGSNEPAPPWWRDPALARPVLAGILWVTGLGLEWTDRPTTASVASALGLIAGASTFVPAALRRLVRGRGARRLGVGLLMTIAAAGAVLLGHLGEAAALAFLFSIAETLEQRAMDRAQRGLRALLSLVPPTARIWGPDGERTVEASELRSGDIVAVGAGDRLATDGVVVTGRSWLDTSAITGESIPVEVGPGDPVPAGAVNGPGSLRFEATAAGRDNSLTQIVRLVEQAHAAKGERARLADRIARPLVPALLVASVLVAVLGSLLGEPAVWFERALVVLVAASPCALAISVPVTVISAIGSASRFGVVITSGEAFEQLGTIRAVAVDKTGTLTRNEPTVVAVRAADGHAADDVVDVAAALEADSNHPLAHAIVAASTRRRVATDVREHPGHGVVGSVDGRSVRVGSPRWIDAGDLGSEMMAAAGMSLVVVEVDGAVAGVIGIRDELRADAAEAVAALGVQGVRTVMLTGDHRVTARAIATSAGIDEVHAEQLPAGKAAWVRRSSAEVPTAMIGDGINDAPALASATVGIAMGATGSAAAVESADVAFTGTDLRLLPRAFAHARRGRAIMTVNIGFALVIVAVLLPLSLLGIVGLTAVVLVHELAEVVVIANGLRAARTTPSTRPPPTRPTPPAPPTRPDPAAVTI